MKTKFFNFQFSIFNFIALALLAAGCAKENDAVEASHRISIFAGTMGANGAKILMDPSNVNKACWVANEEIDLNGTPYTIGGDTTHGFYLDLGSTTVSGTLYAIYPATLKDALGNDIVVTNGAGGGCAIDIHSLAVNIHSDGKHDVIFPMAATAAENSTSLQFDHLTGGLKLTLSNTTEHTVTRLVVTATRADGSAAIYKDIKPTWAGSQLPGIPGGEVGEITGDQGAQFISDMTLMMNSQNSLGIVTHSVTIPASGSISFCIPMLTNELKNLTITGYNGDTQVFQKTKELPSAISIPRNQMYNIPTININ
jgi:hypothetical protein